jgi:DNA-binding NarL/FixJ family response regulator
VLAATAPDVVLMDINLPGASGVEVTRRVSQMAPGHRRARDFHGGRRRQRFRRARCGGARIRAQGCVRRRDHRGAADRSRGRRGVRCGVARRLLAQAPAQLSGPARLSQQHDLTAREREVLDLLAEGESNRQIARTLGVSLKTVQNHVSRILDKLQAADRTQAVIRARGVR